MDNQICVIWVCIEIICFFLGLMKRLTLDIFNLLVGIVAVGIVAVGIVAVTLTMLRIFLLAGIVFIIAYSILHSFHSAKLHMKKIIYSNLNFNLQHFLIFFQRCKKSGNAPLVPSPNNFELRTHTHTVYGTKSRFKFSCYLC